MSCRIPALLAIGAFVSGCAPGGELPDPAPRFVAPIPEGGDLSPYPVRLHSLHVRRPGEWRMLGYVQDRVDPQRPGTEPIREIRDVRFDIIGFHSPDGETVRYERIGSGPSPYRRRSLGILPFDRAIRAVFDLGTDAELMWTDESEAWIVRFEAERSRNDLRLPGERPLPPVPVVRPEDSR